MKVFIESLMLQWHVQVIDDEGHNINILLSDCGFKCLGNVPEHDFLVHSLLEGLLE